MKIMAYCIGLTFIMAATNASAGSDSDLPYPAAGVPGKNIGEIVQPITVQQVAAWCDFSKQIVVSTNRNFILCVFNGYGLVTNK